MPFKQPLILSLICLLPLCVNAEKGQSVMFQSEENPLTTPPESSLSEPQGDKCQELLRKIESLKGKPQRKHTAMERYKQACSSLPE